MDSNDQIIRNKIYTAEEAAELIRVERRTIYKLIENREIKGRKIGKGYKVLGENLLTYVGTAPSK